MIEYSKRPGVSDEELAQITNALARWLPADTPGDHDLDRLLGSWDRGDWLAAAWVVYWQSALPWFSQRLREANVSAPLDIVRRLSEIESESRARTKTMLAAAVELFCELERSGVEAVPLKGAALAPLYYPDPLLRPLGDLDILVHREDLSRGLQVLKELGYRFFSRSAEDEVYLRATGSR